jgi:N-acetylmuramoyl-L-alanine amidase
MAFKEKFNIGSKYIPTPSKRRSGLPISKVHFLVAHDTGNPGSTASENINFYCQTRNAVPTASAHLFVDDNQILECVPALTGPPEKAWHVLYNKPKDNELFGVNANDAAIGVEYCFGGNINADQAYAKYVWVLAKLCNVFNLDPSKSIVGHHFLDPERKTDPVTGLLRSRRTYSQLLRDVVLEYNDCIGGINVDPIRAIIEENGTVKTAVKLNLRSTSDTRGNPVEVVLAGTDIKYTGLTKQGMLINNNSLWYRDTNGHWFWDGGLVHN